MTFSTEKRLFSHSSKPPPMSRTGGKPAWRNRTRENPLCSRLHPLGILSKTPSRNNIIPWGHMRTSTYNVLHCDNKGIKICMSWRIYSIPYAQSWVSNIQRNIWCWSIAVVYTDTFRRKWSSSISPCLVRHTGMLPRLSRNSNRRSETLDLRIKSKWKVPPSRRPRTKPRHGISRQPAKAASK